MSILFRKIELTKQMKKLKNLKGTRLGWTKWRHALEGTKLGQTKEMQNERGN